jgi:hypothetical protein
MSQGCHQELIPRIFGPLVGLFVGAGGGVLKFRDMGGGEEEGRKREGRREEEEGTEEGREEEESQEPPKRSETRCIGIKGNLNETTKRGGIVAASVASFVVPRGWRVLPSTPRAPAFPAETGSA